jgi:hypothetical protein
MFAPTVPSSGVREVEVVRFTSLQDDQHCCKLIGAYGQCNLVGRTGLVVLVLVNDRVRGSVEEAAMSARNPVTSPEQSLFISRADRPKLGNLFIRESLPFSRDLGDNHIYLVSV